MLYVKTIPRFLFVMLILIGINVYAEFSKEYHETFKVSEGSKLYLRQGDGNVTVTSWDKNELQVDVYYRAAGDADDDKTFRVDFDQRDQKIYIVSKEFNESWVSNARRIFEYRYEIKGPAYLFLDIEGDDGDVNVVDWQNNVSINLSDGNVDLDHIKANIVEVDLEDGDLHIRHLKGELSVDCQDGNVTLEDINTPFAEIGNQDGSVKITRAKGKFRIRLEDGNCRISDMTAEDLDLRAQDGNIDIHLDGISAPRITAVCQDGSIDLEIPSGINAELQINARRGSIRTNFEKARIEKDEKKYLRAILGTGEGRIDLSASDGRVTVKQY